jgi:hypothetical protein
LCVGITVTVRGKGFLGDITNKCSEESETGTADFQTTGVSGQQKYKQVTTTGETFDLEAQRHPEGSVTAAMEAAPTLALNAKSKVNCTLP